ncbi:MAG: NUDIX domain-containing protein [Chloroflexi bacterium]|jgi:8-oxo-dGTP pyrophosphatase MutT (NUDIX family)|nr:NUDIX domain-containing protein [Chloroflexota bacterium]
MSYRAGIILLQDDKVALIERHRAGLHYFTFPGGHVDEGENPEQAAVRETEEELGLQVTLKQNLAQISWHGKWQYYYLVEVTGGTFGSGRGEEILDPLPECGTYRPMWMPVAELLDQPVMPRKMAEIVVRFSKEGWPEEPVIIPE